MSPSKPRHVTRAKNANTHPGDAIPKRTKHTKEQVAAAKEAEKATKKKQEATTRQKLTKVAQAADNVVLEMQAQKSSEPCVRPKCTLKWTYAMLDMTDSELPEAEKETQPAMSDTDEQSNNYKPSESSPRSESTIDPASQSDTSESEPLPKKTKRRSKKNSVIAKIQAQRQHLDAILEEPDVEEQEQEDLMADSVEPPSRRTNTAVKSQHAFPLKAGLKKSWAAQKHNNNVKNLESIPKPSANRDLSQAPTCQVVSDVIPKTPHTTQIRPHPRGRPPKTLPSSQDQAPEALSPLTPLLDVSALQATPVNVGSGIPEDESDTEEQAAAKSSPLKAGKRVTSNSIVSICPASRAGPTAGSRKPFPQATQAAPRVKQHAAAAKPVIAQPQPQQISAAVVLDDHDLYSFSDWDAEDTDINHKSKPIGIDSDSQPSINTAASKSIRTHEQTRKRIDAHPPSQVVAIPKPRNNFPKPAEPETIELELEPELEYNPNNNRASVAPSDGNPGHPRLRRAGRSQAATYDSLPSTVPREIFKEVYVPTITKYLAKLANAWSTNTTDYVRVVQLVWNEVFPTVLYTFSAYGAQCSIIRLITQRTYEWRGKFASAAIDSILDLEASDPDYQDPDFRQEWVAWARKENVWPFLYADTESENPEEWSGTFASTPIMRAFAAHLTYTANAIVIKQLKDLEGKQPSGALALTTTAVEQALTIWDAGDLQDWRQLRDKDKPSLPKFDSTTWGLKTQSWLTSISKMDSNSWDDIISLAYDHVKPTSRKQPSSSRLSDNLDTRATLVARPRRK